MKQTTSRHARVTSCSAIAAFADSTEQLAAVSAVELLAEKAASFITMVATHRAVPIEHVGYPD